MAAKVPMIMSVDTFLLAGNPSKINSTRGDHFPQANFSLPARPSKKRKDGAHRAQLPAAIRTHQ
jgi:hypothetical protein